MKCKHCGKEIDLDASFCEACGHPSEPIAERIGEIARTISNSLFSFCKKNKWIIPVIAILIIVVITCSAIANHKRNIDFTDYLLFDVSGYDGYGTLKVSVDYDALAEELFGKEPDSTSKKKYKEYIKYSENKKELEYLISVDVDRAEDLANGDFFLATVYVENDDLFEDNKVTVTDVYSETFEIGVDTEKLFELNELNLLEHVAVEFKGKDGNGNAYISYEEIVIDVEPMDGKRYTLSIAYSKPLWGQPNFNISSSRESDGYVMVKAYIENDYNLSNGDIVKVKLEPPAATLAEQLGLKISTTEKEFTVFGLE